MPWLEEIEPHAALINPIDAKSRGIENGDLVDIFNGRGRIRILVKVTERIMPGVVCVYQGEWYDPDQNGVDLGGCSNTLTKDDYSPGGAFFHNSALVQVELSPKNPVEVSR